MEIKKFENKKNLESTLLLKISTCISDAIKKYGDARFLLSDGSRYFLRYLTFRADSPLPLSNSKSGEWDVAEFSTSPN